MTKIKSCENSDIQLEEVMQKKRMKGIQSNSWFCYGGMNSLNLIGTINYTTPPKKLRR